MFDWGFTRKQQKETSERKKENNKGRKEISFQFFFLDSIILILEMTSNVNFGIVRNR
jgi:hypothetical protein